MKKKKHATLTHIVALYKDFHYRLLLCLMCLHLEGVLSDGLDDFFKEHFGGERVSVEDHGLSFITIPAVQLNTSTALMQSSKHAHKTHEFNHKQRAWTLNVIISVVSHNPVDL